MDGSGNDSETGGGRRLARKIVIDLSIMTAIGIVLAFIGPFGSFAEPLAYRLVSWVSFAWVGYAIYSPMSWVVDRLHNLLDLPQPPLWLFAVAIATVPMTAIVWSIGFLPRPVPLPSLEQALSSYFYVFLVGGGITVFFYALESRKSQNEGGEQTVPIEEPREDEPLADQAGYGPRPRLLDRIPAHLGSSVIALENEDHYVRVHTALGSELILIRMRDAVTELDGIEGAQVHRSWWVARDAVEDTARDGRNVRLKLNNGLDAPVSRARVQELRDAGWF